MAPETREQLLASTVGQHLGCWLGIRCGGCTKSAYIPLKLMAAKHGAHRRLDRVVARLRCAHCRSRPATVWLVDYPIENCDNGGRVATWSVELLP